jgi:hypothetical protein
MSSSESCTSMRCSQGVQHNAHVESREARPEGTTDGPSSDTFRDLSDDAHGNERHGPPSMSSSESCTSMRCSQGVQHHAHVESREARPEGTTDGSGGDAFRDLSDDAHGNAGQASDSQAQMSSSHALPRNTQDESNRPVPLLVAQTQEDCESGNGLMNGPKMQKLTTIQDRSGCEAVTHGSNQMNCSQVISHNAQDESNLQAGLPSTIDASTDPSPAATVAETARGRKWSTDGTDSLVVEQTHEECEGDGRPVYGARPVPLLVAQTQEDCENSDGMMDGLKVQALTIIQDRTRCEAVAAQCTRSMVRLHGATYSQLTTWYLRSYTAAQRARQQPCSSRIGLLQRGESLRSCLHALHAYRISQILKEKALYPTPASTSWLPPEACLQALRTRLYGANVPLITPIAQPPMSHRTT